MEQTWPEKMTKTRKEMNDLDLPWGGGEAQVIEDEVADQTRWSTVHDLIFRLPGMPDDLAYQTSYSKGSTEQQDEAPWENEDAICTLVRKVSKVVETWTADPVPEPETAHGASIYVPMSAARQIRNDIYRACDAERERQIEKGYDAAHDDDHADGEISGIAAAVASGNADVAPYLLRGAAQHILDKWPRYADRIRIAHAMLTADLERLARANGQPQPRIELARMDPDTLVGIAPCDDGSPGWVVLAVKSDGTSDMVEPLGDGYGEIVYMDILDAAEVLKTGIVWKHDMGEDELTEDPDSGPLEDVTDPDSSPLDATITPLQIRPCDERGRIEYTAMYRMRESGEAGVTRFWSLPGSSREYLIRAMRHALIVTASSQGQTLHWHTVERSIDPDSYVFDPPPSDVDTEPSSVT